jgi:hypothetical protein
MPVFFLAIYFCLSIELFYSAGCLSHGGGTFTHDIPAA